MRTRGGGDAGYEFDERVRAALWRAREVAAARRHEHIGTEHLLLGLLATPGGGADHVLATHRVQPDALARTLEAALAPGTGAAPDARALPFTARGKVVLERAMDEAKRLQSWSVGTHHLLLGLCAEGKGMAAEVLREAGVTLESAREAAARLGQVAPSDTRRTIPITGVVVGVQYADGSIVNEWFDDLAAAREYLAQQ